ncbi:MAG: hypothetical protein ACRD35_04265 [Candidatus Acidiferrales bacterium]
MQLISQVSVENMVDLGMHTVPLAAIAFGWGRLRKVPRRRLDRLTVLAFSGLTLAYVILFLGDALSLGSEALFDKILFSRIGIRVIYLNLLAGVDCGITLAFRYNPARRYLMIAAILVAVVSFLDIVRAVDAGI